MSRSRHAETKLRRWPIHHGGSASPTVQSRGRPKGISKAIPATYSIPEHQLPMTVVHNKRLVMVVLGGICSLVSGAYMSLGFTFADLPSDSMFYKNPFVVCAGVGATTIFGCALGLAAWAAQVSRATSQPRPRKLRLCGFTVEQRSFLRRICLGMAGGCALALSMALLLQWPESGEGVARRAITLFVVFGVVLGFALVMQSFGRQQR